jgi:alkylated DNA repair dioxygenase AlkB
MTHEKRTRPTELDVNIDAERNKRPASMANNTLSRRKRIELLHGAWIDSTSTGFPRVTRATFRELWQLHPEKRALVFVFGTMYETPRWQQAFGQAYTYSGVRHAAWPLDRHPYLIELIEWVRHDSRRYSSDGEPLAYNSALVNWYEDGEHYIAAHSDDERQLVSSAPIYSFSFGCPRTFRVKLKRSRDGVDKGDLATVDLAKVDLRMLDNTLLVMGGTMQQHYTHEVPKEKRATSARINITFRVFK